MEPTIAIGTARPNNLRTALDRTIAAPIIAIAQQHGRLGLRHFIAVNLDIAPD